LFDRLVGSGYDGKFKMTTNQPCYEATLALWDWSDTGWCAYNVAAIDYNRDRLDDAAFWTDRCATAWAKQGSKHEQATVTRLRGLIEKDRQNYSITQKELSRPRRSFNHQDTKAQRLNFVSSCLSGLILVAA